MPKRASAEGFAIGLFAGAITGVAIGILYASHSGRVTRGLIDEKVDEVTRKRELSLADSGRMCQSQKAGEICQSVIRQAHPLTRRDRETAGVEGKVEAVLVEGVKGAVQRRGARKE